MRDPEHALDVLTRSVKRRVPPLLLVLGLGSAQATELVYYPVNPNFGGSPLNGPTLLSQAQAQNRTKDPDLDRGKLSALEQLKESLQRAVVSRLANAATAGIIGTNGALQEGTAEIAGLFITVTKNADGSFRLRAVDDSGQVLEVDL